MRIELFALQKESALEWVDKDSYVPTEANVFRERVIGKNGTARRVLKFFGLDKSDIDKLIYSENASVKTDEMIFTADVFEDKKRITVKFLQTV